MDSNWQDRHGDKASFSGFSEAVGRGAIWGLLPGVILGIAYAFTPTAKDILSTTLLFTVFSSFFGGSLGGFIILINRTIKFATWSLGLLGASISSILFLIGSNALSGVSFAIGGVSLIIFPILLILRNYFSEKSPTLIKDALGHAIPLILSELIIIGFAILFNKVTGDQFHIFNRMPML